VTEPSDDAPPSETSAPSPDAAESKPKLLLADDTRTSLKVLTMHLQEKYEVVAASDGEEAWQALVANPRIELVVTDVQMPKLSGQELLQKIRGYHDPNVRNLPVIVMTAEPTEKHQAFDNGASDFLDKPVDPVELNARLQVHLRLARTIRQLEESRRALDELASTDPLTRLQNRRTFFSRGARDLEVCKQRDTDLSAMMLDIDHFKKINDTWGHQAGDVVLVGIGRLLTKLVRGGDTVARFGGEEFALLLPETTHEGAAALGERIRAAVEREEFFSDGMKIPVTASIGVATVKASTLDSVEWLLKDADRRLYVAKRAGRNQVCDADPPAG